MLVPWGGSIQLCKLMNLRSNVPLITIVDWPGCPAETSGVKRAGTSLSKAIATVHSPVAMRISYLIL